ncbi:MAG: type I pullulanase [Chitinophagaceae bacterium]|jgi:pullulanase|nr:type I pullulanase [Chitinophagaceae bacterium]
MRIIPGFLFLLIMMSTHAQIPDFGSYPVYGGKDLGLTYKPSHSAFRIWAPTAEKAELRLYASGTGGSLLSAVDMKKADAGTWTASIGGNQQGKYYAFRVRINGTWSDEVPDPYARMVGTNGKRGMIGDLKASNPSGWEKDRSPQFGRRPTASGKMLVNQKTDAVIYELHVRDASIYAGSGIRQKGKFLGLTESGTRNADGLSTGLDHLVELGVTHVHLLPFYDFFSVDESKPDSLQYNWGYDPLNYNTPEGSYSTNPEDGLARVREFKQLVKTFHERGLRVVMDVVYNHTMFLKESSFQQLVPGYYYRQKADGSFSDATACGNETASERPMMRKFILESVKYWVEEFHVDGFRFDLMGVHDIVTMNEISKSLHALKPDILLYGEGWTAGASPLPDTLRALKKNAHLLDRIAVFSDDIRDGIKGSVFVHDEKGFASGRPAMEQSIRFGITAACKHPQVNYTKVNYSKAPYASQPWHTVSYCECHDNHVLWDKLSISAAESSPAQRREMHKLALTTVLTSQGISFIHAGTEFLRTKYGVENSFNAGDSINRINWDLKTLNKDVNEYVRELIRMRKNHPAFRMMHATEIAGNLQFMEESPENVVAYTINGAAVRDSWKKIMVLLNGNTRSTVMPLPAGNWTIHIRDNAVAGDKKTVSGSVPLAASAATILYQE